MQSLWSHALFQQFEKQPADTNTSPPPPAYVEETLDYQPRDVLKDTKIAYATDSKPAFDAAKKRDGPASALTSEFDLAEGKLVVEEIKKLSQTTISISNDFDTIRTLLVRLDQERSSRISERLAPRWKIYQERYDGFLRESRATALKAKGSASEYVLFMSEVENGDHKFIMDEMPDFIEVHLANIRESAEAARKVIPDFTLLIRDIEDFAVELYAKAPDIDAKAKETRDQIDVVIADIASINTRLQELEALIKSSTEALNSSGMGFGCAAILSATIILAPFVARRIYRDRVEKVSAAAVLEKATSDAEEQNQQRALKMRELAEVKKRADSLEQLYADIGESHKTIEHLCMSLGVIGNIWSYFEKDAMQVEQALLTAQKSQIRQKEATTKLKLGSRYTCHVYSRMADILGVYAAQTI